MSVRYGPQLRVLIVGGGIAGLTLGLRLTPDPLLRRYLDDLLGAPL